jgi:hypothetical protein
MSDFVSLLWCRLSERVLNFSLDRISGRHNTRVVKQYLSSSVDVNEHSSLQRVGRPSLLLRHWTCHSRTRLRQPSLVVVGLESLGIAFVSLRKGSTSRLLPGSCTGGRRRAQGNGARTGDIMGRVEVHGCSVGRLGSNSRRWDKRRLDDGRFRSKILSVSAVGRPTHQSGTFDRLSFRELLG